MEKVIDKILDGNLFRFSLRVLIVLVILGLVDIGIYRLIQEFRTDAHVAIRLNNIGIDLMDLGDLKDAMSHFEQALQIAEESLWTRAS